MKARFYVLLAALLGGGVFFLLSRPATTEISAVEAVPADLPPSGHPEALPPVALPADAPPVDDRGDIGPQPQMANPPVAVQGIYLTGWSAGSKRKMDSILALMERTGANAVVIDIKDYSGYVSYDMNVPEVDASGAEKEPRIIRPNALIKQLHDRGIYVIGRVTVFQDTILAQAHPEWAVQSKTNGGLWKDRKGLAWMDPAGRGTWDYAVAIAKDGFARGFDEINFDYIRFPSDGNLDDAKYPFWDGTTPKHEIMAQFFAYLRQALPGELISADLFGLATVAVNDMGIGQLLTDAYPHFDYVSPMVYPSHFAPGFIGYKNPAQYPYEVISYSLKSALARRDVLQAATGTPPATLAKIRPWLQDFDLGAAYTPAMVQREVQSVQDVLNTTASSTAYAGYLFWDPNNNYN